MSHTTPTATEYIQHHLKHLQFTVYGEPGSFFTVNIDTVFFSVAMGLLFLIPFRHCARRLSLSQPGRFQVALEMLAEFVDQQIKDTEAQLKDLQQKKRSVDEEDIPSLMETMGVESLTVDGNKVSIDKFVSARIPETKKQEAFQFLREIGEGDLIKNEVVVSFSMGQDNQAGSVVADLENKGFAPVKKQHVHPMTLKTWVKNRIESGKEIDFDLFGVYQGNRAKIKGGQ